MDGYADDNPPTNPLSGGINDLRTLDLEKSNIS
jgi:hypothetical protein